jgi:signal peptidase I
MPFSFKRKKSFQAQEPQSRKRRIWANFKSLASTVVFVWLFTNHIAQATIVPTESMVPTILVGDHFFLDKVAFPANYPEALQKILPERTIRRGDLVAFWSPENPDLRLVKRVVALPGEEFGIRDGDVYINGEKLKEPYAAHSEPGVNWRSENFAPVTLPPDSFFMMGDNRDNSRDSRYFGVVQRKALIGKPTFVYWSYESDPYRGNRSLGQWAEHYVSMATHFFTRTRWARTGTVLR